jgi:hypothetical protein
MNFRIIIISFLLLTACTPHGVEIPPGVIEIREMTSILSDMHLAQMELNNRIRVEKADVTADDYFELILKKHNITRKQFLTSFRFYSDNPEILNIVYDSIIMQLSRKEGSGGVN